MTAPKISFPLLLAVLLFVGCDGTALQDQFADDAGRVPEGYTATDRNGAVLDEDPDDWRTAPVYLGKVRVEPAFPNPTSGESVTVTVSILEFGGVSGGLYLRARQSNGVFVLLDALQDDAPGTYLMTFSPANLARSGLVRLFVLDARGEIVSYGDVLLN